MRCQVSWPWGPRSCPAGGCFQPLVPLSNLGASSQCTPIFCPLFCSFNYLWEYLGLDGILLPGQVSFAVVSPSGPASPVVQVRTRPCSFCPRSFSGSSCWCKSSSRVLLWAGEMLWVDQMLWASHLSPSVSQLGEVTCEKVSYSRPARTAPRPQGLLLLLSR